MHDFVVVVQEEIFPEFGKGVAEHAVLVHQLAAHLHEVALQQTADVQFADEHVKARLATVDYQFVRFQFRDAADDGYILPVVYFGAGRVDSDVTFSCHCKSKMERKNMR